MSKIMKAMRQAARDAAKPMDQRKRYSILEGEGHDNWLRARAMGCVLDVRLDGEKVDCVQVADEVRGLVIVIPQPPRLNADRSDVLRVTRRGVVGVDLVRTP